MTITFKTKLRKVYYPDDTFAWEYFDMPEIQRRHCDMQAFRNSKRFGGYANSDLFLGMLKGELRKIGMESGVVKLHQLPANVAIENGFLSKVTITLEDR